MNCFCKILLILSIILSLSSLRSKDNKLHDWGHRTFYDNFVASHESLICSLPSPLKDSLSYEILIYHLHLNQVSFYAVSPMTSHTLKTAFDINNKREILFGSYRHKGKKIHEISNPQLCTYFCHNMSSSFLQVYSNSFVK